MKKTILRIAAVVAALSLSACHFLDENMNTHYSSEDIYGSESALEAAVNGCYYAFAISGFYGGNNNEWFAPASGIVHWGLTSTQFSDAQKRYVSLLNFTQYSKHPNNLQVYKFLYAAVYKCNKLIAALPDSPVAQEYKDQIEAEARFVRAQAYFHITRRWGNAPIHLDPPTTLGQTNAPRSPFWEIYKLIMDDLNFAEAHGRTWDEQFRIAGTGTGRVCRNAATASKALVYLTIGTLLAHDSVGDNFWTCSNDEVYQGFAAMNISSAEDAFGKALACAKEVMPETATDSPYRLAENYAQLFRWTDPEDFQLRERIFCITSTNEGGTSQLATWSLPGAYNNTTSNANNGRIRPSRFLFQKWCEAYGGTKGAGNAANIYVTCGDPRLDISLIHTSYIGADGATKYCYPWAASVLNNSREQSQPYFKKYYDPKYDATAGYADLYVMRLAEVYLIAAEACANLCSSPADAKGQEAIGYVNILLDRARHSTSDGTVSSEPANWNAAAIGTRDNLIDKIFWERAFEMVGEEHEYFDTHRMGAQWLADHVAKPHNAFLFQPEQDDYGTGPTAGHRRTSFGYATHGEGNIYPVLQAEVRKGLICAFPNDELVYNTALTLDDQNPSEIFWE